LSQSPSLRGSGRFRSKEEFYGILEFCLNPLHCGAVVASFGCLGAFLFVALVSIPFIAGQWSLLAFIIFSTIGFCASQSPSLRGSGRFHNCFCGSGFFSNSLNPLHCGAVVASSSSRCTYCSGSAGLNPLHCGAVVASTGRSRRSLTGRPVSIPFIAGQWSLHPDRSRRLEQQLEVSIPFIAGQWSLLDDMVAGLERALRVSIPFIAGQWSLHAERRAARLGQDIVSIPFIAGQWSLPRTPCKSGSFSTSLNPLHCGAVVASEKHGKRKRGRGVSQSPSLRGSGRFKNGVHFCVCGCGVSIPFIAGQWSLPGFDRSWTRPPMRSQSPSLRGSGRFARAAAHGAFDAACLNPLHCGAVVAS